jgi:hypothetical protein
LLFIVFLSNHKQLFSFQHQWDKNFHFRHTSNAVFLLQGLQIHQYCNFRIIMTAAQEEVILQHTFRQICFFLWLNLPTSSDKLYNTTMNLDIFDYHFDQLHGKDV